MTIYKATDTIDYTDTSVTPNVTTTSNAFSYGPNITDFGTPYQVAYVKHVAEIVELGGEVKSSVALSAGAVLIQLSTELTPIADEQAHVIAGGMMVEVSIQAADGKVVLAPGTSIMMGDKISLNNCNFLHRDAFNAPDPAVIDDTVAGNTLLYTYTDPTTNIMQSVYTDGTNIYVLQEDATSQAVKKSMTIGPNTLSFVDNTVTPALSSNKDVFKDIQELEVSFVSDGTKTSLQANVSFGKTYSVVPTVVPGNISQTVSYCDVILHPFITSVTATGFTVVLHTWNQVDKFSSGTLKIKFLVYGK